MLKRLFQFLMKTGAERVSGRVEAVLQDVRAALIELKTIHEKSKRFGAREGAARADRLLERVNNLLEHRQEGAVTNNEGVWTPSPREGPDDYPPPPREG